MKQLSLTICLLSSLFSLGQVWEHPFDTTAFYISPEDQVGDLSGVISYVRSDYDTTGKELRRSTFVYDDKSRLTEEIIWFASVSSADTTLYAYSDDGRIHETTFVGKDPEKLRVESEVDTKGHVLSEKVFVADTMASTIRYVYSKKGLLTNIVFENRNEIAYQYTKRNKVSEKAMITPDGVFERVNYRYPKKRSISYTKCILLDESVFSCDSVIGIFNKRDQPIQIESYLYMETTPHVIRFEYDQNERLIRVDYGDQAEVRYIRNERGLIIRIEHQDVNGELFMYSTFKYEYR